MEGIHHEKQENHLDADRDGESFTDHLDYMPRKRGDSVRESVRFAPHPASNSPVRNGRGKIPVERSISKFAKRDRCCIEKPARRRHSNSDNRKNGGEGHLKAGVQECGRIRQKDYESAQRDCVQCGITTIERLAY